MILQYLKTRRCKYRKRGKIRWAKLSQIPPNVVFHGKTFTVPYVTTLKQRHYTKLISKDSWENFRGALENRESLAQRIFLRLRYYALVIVYNDTVLQC